MAVNGLNRNGMTPHDELCEMKTCTPMLHATQLKNSSNDVEVDCVRVFEVGMFLGFATWLCRAS